MRARLGLGILLLTGLAALLGVSGAAGGTSATASTTVIVQVNGGGLVTGGGGQINCGSGATNCYATFVTSGSVDLTAIDEAGWTFSSWGGCDDTSGDNDEICTVSLNGSVHEVTASFTPDSAQGTKTLSVTRPDGGDIAGGQNNIDCGSADDETDCSYVVPIDSTVTLVEDPDDGFTFGGWGGDCSGGGPSCSVFLSDDRDVTATFTKSASTFALAVSVTGNGLVAATGISCTSAGGDACSNDEAAGSTVTLTAQPGSGANFQGWGGACAGTSLTCSVTMSSAKSVTAAFSGTSPSGSASQFPLGVSVTGDGNVTGGGISCGKDSATCTVDEDAGDTVTLTAAAASGAKFNGWSGACTGTSSTCSVKMDAAKSVSASFSGSGSSGGGSGSGNKLSVTVTGPGSVGGGGIQCGNGGKTCSADEDQDTQVTLTAAPAANATFTGWDGSCSGTEATCTVTMDSAKSVSAAFKSTSRTPTGQTHGGALRSRAHPLVRRTKSGFAVTLRFTTTKRGLARVRALRAGRVQTALSFTVAQGPATVGPFPVARSGFYAFELTIGSRLLQWHACLGRCGGAAHAAPFVLTRGPARAVDAGAVWSLTVHFHATMPSAARLRVLRNGRTARDVRFAPGAGEVTGGPFLLSPGTYQLRLTATDAYGRARKLTWYAFLP